MQGAATMPATRPIPSACANPVPRTIPSFCCTEGGRFRSKAPNMLAASATRKTESTPTTQGDDSAEPNAFPESAAKTPSTEYVMAIPPT